MNKIYKDICPSAIIKSILEEQMNSIEYLHLLLKTKIDKLDRADLQSVRIITDCLETIKDMYADTHDIFDNNKIG